jgi:hypothetical protein
MPGERYKSFLSSFPLAVRAAVESAAIRADRVFVAANEGAGSHHDLERLATAYIMQVFLAFTRSLCKLGSASLFEIRDIEFDFSGVLASLASIGVSGATLARSWRSFQNGFDAARTFG